MQTVLLHSGREVDLALVAGAVSAGFSASTRALIAERPGTPRDRIHRGAAGSGHRLPLPTRAAQAAVA
ncbi:hypothetical protein [Jidongwangia harbinensis]|uniref:hypothetical protein n=1 Tax=Jidongwangia harbinensis TaxID=2878561 RepID=UPI001CDA345D|nr:hypothetical protein [Jidongwangia harbinensis]MCA2211720.1 hypothetical protein [Jidongwangia harbinensis]